MKRTSSVILIILIFILPAYSWEEYDVVVATVNDTPIVESEVDLRYSYLAKTGKLRRRGSYGRSRILDDFIERALVSQAAEKESILVSDIKVVERLKKMMQPYFARKVKASELDKIIEKVGERIVYHRQKDALPQKDEKHDELMKGYITYIEKTQRTTFDLFFEEMRTRIMRELVMSIAIGVSPPSKEEAKKWFYRHRSKLGAELNIQHILIRPKGTSLTAQREAFKKISAIRAQALKGKSFDALARKYSEDRTTAVKGGRMGWTMLQDLDPYFANHVYKMKGTGSVSQVFKSRAGLHIARLLGKKPVSYKNVENLIMMKLYSDKMMEQFNKWVEKQKELSDVKIYMSRYIKG